MNQPEKFADRLRRRSNQIVTILMNHRIALFLFLGIFSFALRIAYTTLMVGWNTEPQLDPTSGDAIFYQTIATNIVKGNGYSFTGITPTADKLPVYPLFLASVYFLSSTTNYATVRLLQILLSTLAVFLTWRIGKNIFNEGVAWLGAVLVAVDPVLIYFAPAYLAENLFILLLLGSICVFSDLLYKFSWLRLVFASHLLGLALLTHGNVALLPPFILIWCVLNWRSKGLKIGLVSLIVIGLTQSAWIARNYLTLGAFVPFTTNGGGAFYRANNAYAAGNWLSPEQQIDSPREVGQSELEIDRDRFRLGWEWIRSNPQDFVVLLPKKVMRLFDPDPHTTRADVSLVYRLAGYFPYGLMLPFILVGLVASFKNRAVWLLYAPILAALVTTLAFYGDSRFRAPLDPYLYLFGAWTIWQVWNGWGQHIHAQAI